ncbi:YgjV family protein [Vibrio sp.]|nr:YgjV family protein [Vibrio sp.]
MDVILIGQTLGFVSFALGVYSMAQKNDSRMKHSLIAFYIIHSMHFILLGNDTSAFSSGLSSIRNYLALRFGKTRWLCLLCITTLIIIGLYLATSYYNLLAIIGSSIGTYALFSWDGIKLRLGFMMGASLWLINNVITGSIGGSLLEASLIIMNIITIVRLNNDNNRDHTAVK